MRHQFIIPIITLFIIHCAPPDHAPGPIPIPNPESRCTQYARIAVKQQQKNIEDGCGFRDPRWHDDYNSHYRWCLATPKEISDLENNNRQALLDQCTGDESSTCQEYAQRAIEQFKKNLKNNCGFEDPRWHENYDVHHGWCLKVPREISKMENQDRQNMLDDCIKGKTIKSESTTFPSISENKKIRLAVIRFKTLNNISQTQNLGVMISEIFTTEVVNSNAFKIVEREQLNKILKEFQIGQSGIIDTQQAQEIGKLLGADAIITGSVMKIGSHLRIDARIIKIKTGIIISAESRQCKEDLSEISRNVKIMAMALAEKFYH